MTSNQLFGYPNAASRELHLMLDSIQGAKGIRLCRCNDEPAWYTPWWIWADGAWACPWMPR